MIGQVSNTKNEIKAYTTWVNSYFGQIQIEIKDIQNEFKDGTKIIQLVELIYKEKIELPWDQNPTTPDKMKENIEIAFSFLKNKKVPLYGIEPNDIINSKKNAILNLIWNLIKHCLIDTIFYRNTNGRQALLQWSKEVTQGNRNVHIIDFTISWANCLAFCTIVNHFNPQSLDLKKCNEVNKINNLNTFLSSLEKLGIISYITTDNYNDTSSEKIFLIQVAVLFNFFVNKNDSMSLNPLLNQNDHPCTPQTTTKEKMPKEQDSDTKEHKGIFNLLEQQKNTEQPKSIFIPPPDKKVQDQKKQIPQESKPQTNQNNLLHMHDSKKPEHIQSHNVNVQEIPKYIFNIDKKFNFREICTGIIQNEDKINTRGKDIVIFIGTTQAGKSTTINCLNGAKYKIDTNEKLKLVNEKQQIALAEIGNGLGMSKTDFPVSYDCENYVLLDTQGFFDTRKGHDEKEIIGSILLEMAIKNAKSVRAVCVVQYSQFNSGITGMEKNGDIIKRLFVNNDNELVPIFFLFNRFTSSNAKILNSFFNGNVKKNDFIKDRVVEKTKELRKALSEDEKQKNMEYFDLFEHNINSGNIGYIDVEDSKTIDTVKKKLKEIPVISRDHILVYRSSDIRREFNNHMEYNLILNVQKNLQYLISLKYPNILFDSISKQIKIALLIISKQIDVVNNSRIVEDFDVKMYENKTKDIEKLIKECDQKIISLKAQLEQLNNSNDENISLHIQTIDNKEIEDLQNQKNEIESNIQDKLKKVNEISVNLERAKQGLDDFDKNYDAALKEKTAILTDLEKDTEHAQKNIYDIDHILEDMDKIDKENPVFDKCYYDHHVFKKTCWEVDFNENIIIDYKNPRESYTPKCKKELIKANEKEYHVKYEATQWIGKKLWVDLKLYTWKKYRPENITYIRTKQKERNSYIQQIERNAREIEKINADLDIFKKSNQVLRKIHITKRDELNRQKSDIEKDITSQRSSLEKCNVQYEMKMRKREMIENENKNKIDQMNKEKNDHQKEITTNLQILTQKKENLISNQKTIENEKVKCKEEYEKNIKIENEKKKETLDRLNMFNRQLNDYQKIIDERSKRLQNLYTDQQYIDEDAAFLKAISVKLQTNTALVSELLKTEQAIKSAKSKNVFKCEIIDQNSAINPELDQNIWIFNSQINKKTSIFCFLQEMDNDLTRFDKWTSELS